MFVFASGVPILRRLDDLAIKVSTLFGGDWDTIFGFCYGWLFYTVGSKTRVLYLTCFGVGEGLVMETRLRSRVGVANAAGIQELTLLLKS